MSKPEVAQGDAVKASEGVVEADLAAIKAAGYATTTILVITNTAAPSARSSRLACALLPRRHVLVVTT